jgi:hypothetical protein
MAEKKKKIMSCVSGVTAITLFVVLLFIRLDIPARMGHRDPPPATSRSLFSEDAWMEIRQKGIKIGYVHRRKENAPEGRKFSEDIFMRINTMGVVQPVTVKTSAHFNPEGQIRDFKFSIASRLFPFNVEGTVDGGKMVVRIGNEKELKMIDMPENVYFSGDLTGSAALAGLAVGKQRTFFLFDPASLSSRMVTVECMGEESLPAMGGMVPAKKLTFDFMGMRQIAWVSADGSVLREEGALGMTLQRVSKEEALAGLDGTTAPDLTEAAAIPVSTTIDNPAAIKKLILRLKDLPAGQFMLDGGRQTFMNGILTVSSENLPMRKGQKEPENLQSFLEPTHFIQSDSPEIIKQAYEIVDKEDSDQRKAEKLVFWVYKNIAKKPVISVPDALQILKNRMGDCNEHAVLLAALARAAGLPARIETGLVYVRGSFFFHAWNVLYVDKMGGWITADAALGQMPADVAHLRFARGALENQTDLAGLIGKLKIDVVRMEK